MSEPTGAKRAGDANAGGSPLEIDCGTCVMQHTDACRDCVVTYVLDRQSGAVVFDAAEERAIRAMSKAGLLPMVRYQAKEVGEVG